MTLPVRYNSAKCSPIIDEETGNVTFPELSSCDLHPEGEKPENADPRPDDLYKNITVSPNLQFYNIPVNTEVSSVHMPTDIYDYCKLIR